jgi:hypothetical protein
MSNEMKERLVRLAEAVAERRDQAAFAELFDYFAPRIKSYLQRLGMEPGQAEGTDPGSDDRAVAQGGAV